MPHSTFRSPLHLPAALLLVGQVLYILITQVHAGGNANDHAAIFVAYAGSRDWTAVHVGQFAAMAILVAGLLGLGFVLGEDDGPGGWAARFGAASAVVALALYGALQAVDGVANKQADLAWVSAPEAEKAARFASAEAVRWIEWGLRSYHDFAFGLALVLLAVAVGRSAKLPRAMAYLMGLSGLAYLGQGWVVGTEGFSITNSVAIVLAWVLSVAWMVWLAVVARRARQPEERRPSADEHGR